MDVYDFDVALPTAFTANAGPTYWLSVMSKTDDPATAFGWTMAVGDWQVAAGGAGLRRRTAPTAC